MAATVEDAIQGYITMHKKKLPATDSSVFIRGIQTSIRIMEKSPRPRKSTADDRPKRGSAQPGRQYREDGCIVRITGARMAQDVFERL